MIGWETTIALFVSIVAAPILIYVMFGFGYDSKFEGNHVLITGGSKGLGLSLALEFVRKKCHVTVVARKETDLSIALVTLNNEAQSMGLSTTMQALAADTTSTEQLAKVVATAEKAAGPIDVLVANAGLSIPGVFAQQPLSDFEKQMDVNFLGVVRSIKCVLPGMLERRKGTIVLTSSMAAVVGFAGYTSYAPTKWAVRGLGDCLYNELQGTGVKVSVAYPPDMDTPGYATEELTKPAICKAVNTALGSNLFSSEQVARKIVRRLQQGAYHLTTPDIGSNLLVSTMTGLSPKSMPLVFGILLAPLLYLVTLFVGLKAQRTARGFNQQHKYPYS